MQEDKEGDMPEKMGEEKQKDSNDRDSSPSESPAMSEDAREAVLVAAAAEKAEARRMTTRLATGKLKQVDYNASPGIQKQNREKEGDVAKKQGDGVHRASTANGTSRANGTNGTLEPRKGRTTRASRAREVKEKERKEAEERKEGGEYDDGNESAEDEDRNSRLPFSATPTDSITPEPSAPSCATDEQGWTEKAIGILGAAIMGTKSLTLEKLMAKLATHKTWIAQEKSEHDVEEYLSTIRKKMKRFSPSVFPKDVKYNAVLAFLGSEAHRLSQSKQSRERKRTNTISQERRLRASLDKKRRRIKKELDELACKLIQEMATRSESEYYVAEAEIDLQNSQRIYDLFKERRKGCELVHERYAKKRQELSNRLTNLEAAFADGLYSVEKEVEVVASNRELQRLENVVKESDMALGKALGDAEASRSKLDVIAKEKSRMEQELYITRPPKRFVERKRKLEVDGAHIDPPSKRRKGIPIRSPAF